MAAIELELLAAILDSGDLSLIEKGHFTPEHCVTSEGQSICNFLKMYRQITNNQADTPTRNSVLERFGDPDMLPHPPVNPDFDSLLHETHVTAMRAQLREFAEYVADIAEAVDPYAELTDLHSRLDNIGRKLVDDEMIGFTYGLDTVLEEYHTNTILPEGIPYPWESLNKVTKGMHKGDFIILSGRPKTRKTFIGLTMVVNTFVACGARVLVFSPEMAIKMMLLRSVAIASQLRYSEFKASELDEEEEERLLELVLKHGRLRPDRFVPTTNFESNHVFMEDAWVHKKYVPGFFEVLKSTNRPVSWLRAKIKEYRPDVVLLDSFYKQAGEGHSKSDSDHKVLTAISRDLKDLAVDENVVVIGTHQINRKGNKEVGDLANLAYSDAFGMDADLILRAITNKIEGENDKTALAMLGGRETDIEGVLINNVPCSDFSEISVITHRNQIKDMLKLEDQQEEKSDAAAAKKKQQDREKANTTKTRKTLKNLNKKSKEAPVEQVVVPTGGRGFADVETPEVLMESPEVKAHWGSTEVEDLPKRVGVFERKPQIPRDLLAQMQAQEEQEAEE